MTLTFPNTYPAVSRLQMNDWLDGQLGLVGCDTTATRTAHFVTHSALTEADRSRVQGAINRYVFDPTYGAPPPTKSVEERLADLEAKVGKSG